ncbi:hypothetical protein HYDPIDRAFT_90945 [Hydnomerulius pinastri MD-312]|uniref:Uncharacterized protein n=1 Tax=Hydnomerulius pinastri MD-312 TaxID=994086 RepID=A0A0C9WET4_9AGAM|nr:hypothetical protein HYDPIDRAFT_90945 [Hydnomerulius pinastri MD-312]
MVSLALRSALVAATTLDVSSGNTTTTSSESPSDLLNDRVNLIAATTVLGVSYGIMISLYFTTSYFLLKRLFSNSRCTSSPKSVPKSRLEWRKTLFHFVYSSVLFILATLYTAGNSQNAIVAYVDNRLFVGGPYQYYVEYMTGQSVMVMADISYFLIFWMTDALILWRFIVFYHKVRYAKWIIPLPCAMYVGVVGPGVDTPYTSLAAILVESAALYGVWSFVFLILCVKGSPGQTIILTTMSQVQVIAPLLIILWIARGKAWTSSSSGITSPSPDQPPTISRLSFGSRPVRVVDEFGFGHMDNSTSRSGSRSLVGSGDVNVIELGLCQCGSEPPSVIDIELCKK